MAEIKYLDKTGLGTVKSILEGLYATKSHSHSKGEIGLGNVDNTADKDKNVKYASSAGYADDSNLLDGKDSTYFDTAPFSTIRDFTLGTLIKTDINYSVTSGDPFYVEIKGNTYVSPGSMHIQIQGYIYNDTIIQYSVTSLGVVYPSEIIAKNVGGYLCFWFPRIAYWHGYYIKVTTGYNYSINRVTDVIDSAEPSGTKRVVLTNTFYTNYSNSNLTISGGGSSGGSALSIKTNSTTYTLTIPTALPASDVYSWAKAANKPSYNAGEVGALPFFKLASGNANDLSQGLTTVTAVVSNQEGSNHSVFLTITDIGTPFQLQIPDSSTNYIYKRYKSGSTWSAWTKLSAGYADTAGSAVDQTARNAAAAAQATADGKSDAGHTHNYIPADPNSIEMIGLSNQKTPFIDFHHYDTVTNDYDYRILCKTGGNTYGQGQCDFEGITNFKGNVLTHKDNTYDLGTSSKKWKTVYAHTFSGTATNATNAVNSTNATNATNATNSTNATNDSDGNAINTTYLKKSGGTLTGSLTFANGTWNVVGDDAAIGDYNSAGMLGLKSVNNNIPGIGFHNSSGTLLGSLKCDAGTLKWNDTAISLNGHGNHVPATQTASNKVFLRNDNTWATITPANIGAATAGHTHSLGNKPESDLSSTYPEGISVGGIYGNGYPFSYGATITACGNGGYFQIAGQWNSDVTSLTDYDKPTEMYIRGRRDSYDVWTTWSRVLTNRNYTSVITPANIGAAAVSHGTHVPGIKSATSVSTLGWSTNSNYVPDLSMLAYWNGAYSGTSSNLTYCTNGTIIGSNNIGSQSVNYAASTGSLYTGSIGSGSDTHASALKNYFNNYKASIPRNSTIGLYSNSYGNGSQYMGYFLSGYNDTPYGGFFVAHYDACYYVGISYGKYNQQAIITSSNIGSQSVNYANTAGSASTATSASSASNAATLSGGSIATWGTLTSGNGYTNVCTWDTGATTGAFSLAGKGGQMSLQLDGYFYQNEGANRVTDVTETVTALGTNGNYLTWTKNGSTNNITVPYATSASSAVDQTARNSADAKLPLTGGTMTGTPYINMPASAASIADSQPFGITYGRIQSYGTMTIAADTDGSTTEFVNITAGYGVSNATAANGLSIGYNTFKWKDQNILYSGNINSHALHYNGFWSSTSGQSIDSAKGMTFVYNEHGAPASWGVVSTFAPTEGSDYKFQLFAEGYSAAGLYYRCKSSDLGRWTDWRIALDSNNYTTYCTPANIGAMPAGDISHGTHITTGAQTWSGTKTFSSEVIFNGGGTHTDICSGISAAFKTKRIMANEIIADSIILGASSGSKSNKDLTIKKYGSISSTSPASLTTLLTFDTIGRIKRNSGGTWISGRDNAIIMQEKTASAGSSWNPAVAIKTSNGCWTFGSCGGETLYFSYDTDTNYNSGSNQNVSVQIPLPSTSKTLCFDDHTHTSFNSLTINGSVTASAGFFDNSDERLKDFYDDIDVDFNKLKSIPKKYFSWKVDENKELHLGTSAQAVKEVYPEIINDNEGTLTVDYSKLSVVALAAIDKLYDENQELKSKISTLEERLAKLEKLLGA